MYFKNIPDELKRINNWVGWKWEERGGKSTKVPINPITLGNAITTNPSTWSNFNQAVSGVGHKYVGIGFVFDGTGLVGVDIDDCRDPKTGSLSPEAKHIIRELDSYTEISQSCRGIHIICKGELPKDGRREGPVEMYETGRYFIMTGNVLDDGHMDIEERTEQLARVHSEYINVTKTSKKVQKHCKNVLKTYENEQFSSVDEIIEKARNAKNGVLFSDLMNGNWEGKYNSQSEADMALCNIIAFWTKDLGTIDRIFRQSGLYREKWDEKRGERTYGDITIQEAISAVSETYEPKRKYDGPPKIDLGYNQLYGQPVKEPIELNPEYKDTTSDLGRSKCFSEKYKGNILWCQDMKNWFIWTGKCWEFDRVLHIYQYGKELIEKMITESVKNANSAIGEEELKKAKTIMRETMKGRSERSIKAMLELAKSDVPIMHSDLDSDPFLLNCQNGIVDLRTKQIFPHNSEFYMSKIAGASYQPNKRFELFHEFLRLITCNDDELIDYFQIVCGMAAVGKVFHEGLAMFHGVGQNGKSTFLNTISKVFGDYACSINPEMLMAQRDGKQTVGITRIDGKRFATAVETEEGRRLSSSMLKQLASTDPITGRELYQNDRTFLPTHTLILATNFLPKVSSTDVGTWRRIVVVPFKANIQATEQIKDYASVLFKEDKDAILSWIVEGAYKYIKNDMRITIPSAVKEATKQYRSAEDWLGNFISECCEIGGDYEESGGKLFEAYKDWCLQNNESYVRRSRDFASALEVQGYEKRRSMRGSEWIGLKLIGNMTSSNFGKYYSAKKESELDEDGLDKYTRSLM